LRLMIAQYRRQVQKLNEAPPNQLAPYVQVYFDTRAFTTILADICSLISSDDELLKNLLEIPIYANLAQEALQSLGLGPAQGRATTLDQYCNGCEIRLNGIFGPLQS